MIIRKKRGFWQLLFTIQGSVLPRVLPQILVVTGLGVLAVFLHEHFAPIFPEYSLASFSILGLMLSLLLGFRNSASYARWWEGRQQLGALIMHARSLGRMTMTYFDASDPSQVKLQHSTMQRIRTFSTVLLYGLRDRDFKEKVSANNDPLAAHRILSAKSPADMSLRLISENIAQARRLGFVSDITAMEFERLVSLLADVQAACERLQNTPIPFAFMLLAHRLAYLFCALLPFALASTTGIATPVISAIAAYAFFGLDALSTELENPFGEKPNQLAVYSIERTLEIHLLDAQGLPVPQALQAKGTWLN